MMIRAPFRGIDAGQTPFVPIVAQAAAALFAALIVIVALAQWFASAPGSADYHALLLPDEDCGEAVVCPLDISAGDMSMPQALDLLEASPWVERIYYSRGMDIDSGYLQWDWSGAQPAYINANRRGSLWFSQGLVQWVEIGTTLRFGDVWVALDRPQYGRVRTSSASDGRLFQVATYYDGGLSTRLDLRCPLDASRFWRAPVVLRANGELEALMMLQMEPDTYELPRRRSCR
ncbi:MAG: hypothetical protein KME04_18865 [Pleurocapsa minor GSE-CHR-MK-17-07R]|jgi:hypothetical protein|nr:hypothetical protein [Pleurocapsa minor GSE-CHR-MK 17-07R]